MTYYHGTDVDLAPGDTLAPMRANYTPDTYHGWEGSSVTDALDTAYFYAVFGSFSSARFYPPHVYEIDAPDAKYVQPGEWVTREGTVVRDVTAEAVKAFAKTWPTVWRPMIEQTESGPMLNMIVHEFENRIRKGAAMSADVRFGVVDSSDPEKALKQLLTLDSDHDGVPNIKDKAPFDPKQSMVAIPGDLGVREGATFNRTPNRPTKPVNTWDKDVMHSVTKDGGFTFHDVVGDGPTDGFMVSVAKHNEVKIPLRDLTSAHVADYMSTHQQELKDPSNYLGGWVHKGNVYLDVSRHTSDRNEAMSLARANQQLGIYDIGKGETLMTEQEQQQAAPKAAFVVAKGSVDPEAFVNALRRQAGIEELPRDRPASAIERAALSLVRGTKTTT